MELLQEAHLLRIFFGETAKHEGKPLYEWLVIKARESELAGATVLRGIMGFGPKSRIYTTKVMRLSQDLPIVVEIVDTYDRLIAFLQAVDEAIPEGMATLEKAHVRYYKNGK